MEKVATKRTVSEEERHEAERLSGFLFYFILLFYYFIILLFYFIILFYYFILLFLFYYFLLSFFIILFFIICLFVLIFSFHFLFLLIHFLFQSPSLFPPLSFKKKIQQEKEKEETKIMKNKTHK